MAKSRTLKKGDKFTAKQIDDGEFTFFMSIKEFSDTDEDNAQVIAFKDGYAWTLNESEIDDDQIPVTVYIPKATSAFGKRPNGENNG